MRLEKITVRNYKSLKNLTLDLGNFNVLIGPNNSGKTNILDCLSFLSDVTAGRPIQDVQRERGEYDHIVFGGDIDENIEIKTYLASEKSKITYNITFKEKKIISELLHADHKMLAHHDEKDVTLFTASGDQIKRYNWADSVSFFDLQRDTEIKGEGVTRIH
ncbi:MAG: AAA family ATPase [Candidatus Bathyarchaeia archaeon]